MYMAFVITYSSTCLATLADHSSIQFFEINLFIYGAHAWLAQFPVSDKVANAVLDGGVIAATVCELWTWQIMEALLSLANIIFLQKHVFP